MPTVPHSGQQIHYTDQGTGPAVVFLHGFLMDSRMFAPQLAALEDAFRCIAIDARGFGQTVWDGQPFDLYDTVGDTLAVLDHLGIAQAAFVGMSQGGYAVLRLALRHPERVAGLVLMGTSSHTDPAGARELYFQTRDTWRTAGPVEPLIQGLAGAIIGPQAAVPEHWDAWLPRWRTYSGEAIFHGMNNLLSRDEIDDQLDQLTCPALIVHGAEDVGVPISNGEDLYRALPGAVGLVRVAGAAHSAGMTHPEVVNPPVRDFLRRVLSA